MNLKTVFVVLLSVCPAILNAQVQTQPLKTQFFKPKIELKQERLLTILPGTCRIRGSYDATTGHVSENIGTIDGRLTFGPSVATRDWSIDAFCPVSIPDRSVIKKRNCRQRYTR